MNDLTLKQLKYFVAIAEELHFGRAAARLGMAQPPLTQQMHKLEQEVGYPLFARQGRGTVLTEAGRVLLDESIRLLKGCEEALEHTRRAARGETGRLTVGTPPSIMLTRLPAVIRRYRERFPDVRFVLRELSTSAIGEGLLAGTIDVGLLREVEAVGVFRSELLMREPVVAALPRNHGLARRSRLTLRQLAGDPFVLFPRRLGEAFYDRLLAFCVDAGFTPRIVQEATQWQSVVTFVETGLGVSLAPACVERFHWRGVVFRPLPGLSTRISVCAPAAATCAPAAAFLDALRTAFQT
jgi:DNA-binding transcriptional LysR family regulator